MQQKCVLESHGYKAIQWVRKVSFKIAVHVPPWEDENKARMAIMPIILGCHPNTFET